VPSLANLPGPALADLDAEDGDCPDLRYHQRIQSGLRFTLAHPFSCRRPDSDDSKKEGSSLIFPLNDVDQA